MIKKRYRDLNSHFRSLFGCRVQKITVDAGMTCPNRDGTVGTGGCIYCNEKGSGTGSFQKGRSISEQIVSGKTAMFRRYKAKKFIAYFQSFTNTYAPLEKLESLYEEALSVPDVVGISIGTRPDCVDIPKLDLLETLAGNHLVWVEYGLQSSHDRTLRTIRRGHDYKCFEKTVSATRNRGIYICAHIILGLPGETKEDMIVTAQRIGGIGIDGVKIHLLYVIKNTPLHRIYQDGRYKCLEQNEYVELVCEIISHLPENMIIQRLTGDPHPEELAAPQWSCRKSETLKFIHDLMDIKDINQGDLFNHP